MLKEVKIVSTVIDKLINFIRENRLFQAKDPVLLAVSGGVDSTVMSQLFKESGLRFGIAHLNFQLREGDSNEDEVFVGILAANLAVPFFVTRVETREYASAHKMSIQMAAREMRYQWLEMIRKEHGYHFIATAHHLNDSAETVLLNIFRGTGIHGLHGIQPKHGKIVRPLLSFTKEELLNYAHDKQIEYREDKSNYETEYDRNKIRLEIVPLLEKFYPDIIKRFGENISKWSDAGRIYNHSISLLKKKIIAQNQDELFISIPALKQYSFFKTLLFETIREFNFSPHQVDQIVEVLDGSAGKVFYSPTHRLLKDRKNLVLSKIDTEHISETYITQSEKTVVAGLLKLRIETKAANDFVIPADARINCLDYDVLEFPLLLRKWERGDYFYPFGMKKKKKKISDYLIDRKIPLHEKENTLVIESGNRIACIVGERIDERFKVAPSTKKVFVIKKLDG